MNKDDLAAQVLGPDVARACDTALPQWFWDEFHETEHANAVDFAIVWWCGDSMGGGGSTYNAIALTPEAQTRLNHFYEVRGVSGHPNLPHG